MDVEILCIGTAVIDILAAPIPEQENWMEKQRIGGIRLGLGGDAANTSVRLADLGWKCGLCAAIGRDSNGAILKGILKERKVDTDYLAVKEQEQTGTALVLVNEQGNRNTFSVKGAHSMLKKEDLPELATVRPRLITIGSLFSLPYLEEDGLLEYLQEAKDLGIVLCADLGSDKKNQGLDGIRRYLPLLDYFWPSDYDACKLTKQDTPEGAAKILCSLGCRNVVIKCGKEGCFYSGQGQESQKQGTVPALHITPLDTTGAGDCMAALMIDQILQGKDLSQMCRFGCVGASLSTLSLGASDTPLRREEINRYIGS